MVGKSGHGCSPGEGARWGRDHDTNYCCVIPYGVETFVFYLSPRVVVAVVIASHTNEVQSIRLYAIWMRGVMVNINVVAVNISLIVYKMLLRQSDEETLL